MANKVVKYKWESWEDFLKLRDYTVVDVVATGASAAKEKIIEIAMLKVLDGQLIDKYHSLINPEKVIPTRVVNLTGISNEDVEAAPKFGDIADDVRNFIGGDVIVAFNSVGAAGFLAKELDLAGHSLAITHFELGGLIKKAYPSLEGQKLDSLAPVLGLDDLNVLRAPGAAEAAYQIVYDVSAAYSTKLATAVRRCCAPMVDYFIEPVEGLPLEGKHVTALGDLTFSVANAKKLVEAAGGIWEAKLSKDVDYLLRGYVDKNKHPAWFQPALQKALREDRAGGHMRVINEVALLKLCGVSFAMHEEKNSIDAVLEDASMRSEASRESSSGMCEKVR